MQILAWVDAATTKGKDIHYSLHSFAGRLDKELSHVVECSIYLPR